MGHEMGHYVLKPHPQRHSVHRHRRCAVVRLPVLRIAVGPAPLGRPLADSRRRRSRCPALVMLLGGILFFVLTPVMNTQTRVEEKEADMFGLNASRQPDGFAQAAIHLGEYRKDAPRQTGGVSSSSTTPAATTGFTPRCSGKARTWNCSKRRIAEAQPHRRPSNPSKDAVRNISAPPTPWHRRHGRKIGAGGCGMSANPALQPTESSRADQVFASADILLRSISFPVVLRTPKTSR